MSDRVYVDIEVKPSSDFALSEEHTFNCSKKLFLQEFETIFLDFIDSITDGELIIRKVRGPEELE